MDDRIEIPTSEPEPPRARPPSHRAAVISIFVLAVVAVVGLTTSGGGPDPLEGDGDIAPPRAVERDGMRPALSSLRLPGTGTVTAILEIDGELVAFAADDNWGSSVWRLDDTSRTWRITGGVPGVTIVDAVAHPDGLAAVGFGMLEHDPVLLIGPATDLAQFTLELATGEVPEEIDVVAGSVFVSARYRDGSKGSPSTTYLVEGSRRARPLARGGAVVEDVLSNEGEILAIGSELGRPAMWTVGNDGSLEPITLDLQIEGRLVAADRVRGDLVGLVIGGFGTELASTSVVRLEAPYSVLDEPMSGTWDRLVRGRDEVLALPDRFLASPDGEVTAYRTDSGISWVAGPSPFVPPGGDERGERTMLIGAAAFRESGALVVAGTASGPSRYPVIASEGEVGASLAIPPLHDPWWTCSRPEETSCTPDGSG